MLSPEVRVVNPPVSNVNMPLSPALVETKSHLGSNENEKTETRGASARKVSIAVVGRFFTGRQSKGHGSAIEAIRLLIQEDKSRSYELHLIGAISGKREYTTELFRSLRSKAEGLPVQFHIDASRTELISILSSATFIWHMTIQKTTQRATSTLESAS